MPLFHVLCRLLKRDPCQFRGGGWCHRSALNIPDVVRLTGSQKENKRLNRERVRKEKALAEAAAILVLRKKLRDYYWETDEDD